MAYPYDLPAEKISNIWNSGSYTPEEVVKYIRDNYTPVNKTSMRNSVGYQISSVQNYVNSHYLGRSTIPVESGYIQKLYSSGLIQINDNGYLNKINSERFRIEDTLGPNEIMELNATGVGFKYYGMTNYTLDIRATGINFREEPIGANADRMGIKVDGLRFVDGSTANSVYIGANDGVCQLDADVGVSVSAPYLKPSNNSSSIYLLKQASGIVSLSDTEPVRINTGIDYSKNLSLLYFAVAKSTGYEADNWIPGNYNSPMSGIPIMSGQFVNAYWITHGGDTPLYSTIGCHLQSDSFNTLKWNIVIPPVQTFLNDAGWLGGSCMYKYVVMETK